MRCIRHSPIALCLVRARDGRCAQVRMGGWRGGDRAVCGPPRDALVATAASVAVRGDGRQRAGHLGWPAAVTWRPGRSAVAPALAARSRRFAPGVLRRPRAGAALPLPAPAALRLAGVLRGRLRADAALPSRAAAAFRVVRRPRGGDGPPPDNLAVPTARVCRRCRRGGAYGGGRGERWQGGLASNSVKRKALGWWGGASMEPRRRDIRVGKKKTPRGIKKNLSLSSSRSYMSHSTKQ